MHGATTIWERWDAIRPDGSINPGEMLSFNHYAYGAVGAWLYGTVAGLQLIEPGWRRFRVAPHPGGGLEWAEAHHDSPNGPIDVRWELDGHRLKLEVGVPTGTTAEVVLPNGETKTFTSGRHTVSS
jgi:alpha-L-rhamnosidase